MSRNPVITILVVLAVAGILYFWNERPAGEYDGPDTINRLALIHAVGPTLVQRDGSLISSDTLDQPQYLAVYISASWCGPCRTFTPSLVQFMKHADPDTIQVLLVSLDRNAQAMQKYMVDYQMPFPAVAFDRVRSSGITDHFEGTGIPNLILMDRDGRILASSFQGQRYLGPGHVLDTMRQLTSPDPQNSPG